MLGPGLRMDYVWAVLRQASRANACRPLERLKEVFPCCYNSALEIIKYFKISVFHWELDQCERADFFGCHCFHKNTLNCLGKANAFESSQGPPLRVFLGSCLDSAGSMKCTFLVQVTQQATTHCRHHRPSLRSVRNEIQNTDSPLQ